MFRGVLFTALVISSGLMTLTGVTPADLLRLARQLLSTQFGAVRGF
jgi:hypothetical protein